MVHTKRCKLTHKIMVRLNNFLYIFNLRQGTILIAVHQIALSSFILIILLVGISHAGDMMSMLHNDMEDDAERRGFDEDYGRDEFSFHEGGVVSTNNQKRFAKAQHLASVTVYLLYTSTVLTSLYLMCCIALLHGAIKYKRQYVLPWIAGACLGVLLLVAAMVVGDGYSCVVDLFGGHNLYHFGCILFVFTFIYAICAVGSFAMELGGGSCARAARDTSAARDANGERMLLLDHAAQCSIVSPAQLTRLSRSSSSRTQFV